MTEATMRRFALETFKSAQAYVEAHREEFEKWLAERQAKTGERPDGGGCDAGGPALVPDQGHAL